MGLDSAQGLGKGTANRVFFVLFAVLAFLLLAAFSSQTARADLLGTVTDVIDQTEAVVETTTAPVLDDFAEILPPVVEDVPVDVVEIVPPVVEDVVEVIPPVIEDVVEIVPPVVEDVPDDLIEVIPPVIEDVVEIVPPVVEDVVEVIPPVIEDVVEVMPPVVDVPIIPGVVIDDPGTIGAPSTPSSADADGPSVPGTAAQGANSSSDQQSVLDVAVLDVAGLLARLDEAGLIGGSTIYGGASTRGFSPRGPIPNQGDAPLPPRGPIALVVPPDWIGAGAQSSTTQSGGGFFGGGMDPNGFFVALAALLALCLTGLIRDRSRLSTRSIFLRLGARPG